MFCVVSQRESWGSGDTSPKDAYHDAPEESALQIHHALTGVSIKSPSATPTALRSILIFASGASIGAAVAARRLRAPGPRADFPAAAPKGEAVSIADAGQDTLDVEIVGVPSTVVMGEQDAKTSTAVLKRGRWINNPLGWAIVLACALAGLGGIQTLAGDRSESLAGWVTAALGLIVGIAGGLSLGYAVAEDRSWNALSITERRSIRAAIAGGVLGLVPTVALAIEKYDAATYYMFTFWLALAGWLVGVAWVIWARTRGTLKSRLAALAAIRPIPIPISSDSRA